MEAIFSVISVTGLRSDAFSFALATLVLSLIVTGVFYISRLIFPQVGNGND